MKLIKLPLLVILLAGWALNAFAQTSSISLPVETQFGEVGDSLLMLERHNKFPDANYFYAFKSANIHFVERENAILARLHYLVRIKIVNKEGMRGAEVGIPYYFDRNIEQITHIKGQTYQQDGSVIPLDTSDIVTVNLNSRYNVKRFLMPGAEPGAVLEYSYVIERKFIEELPDFQLSHPVPVSFAQLVLNNPKYLRYEVISDGVDSSQLMTQNNYIDTSTVKKVFTVKQPEPKLQEVWAAKNVAPVIRNKMAGSYNEQTAKLKFQLSEFGRPRQPLEISWDYVVASMRRRINPWENISQYPVLDSLGAAIASQYNSPVAAQDSIYHFLNKRMKYNENKGSFTNNKLDSVLAGEFSSRAAINLTLLGLLKGAGIEAYPLFLSARNFGEINKDFPSIFQFNNLLIYSEIDGTPYFLDASFSHGSIGLIPTDSYNESGLVFKKDGFKWVDINPDKSKFYIDLDIEAALDRTGNLAGTVTAVNEGYTAREIRKMKDQGMNPADILKQAFFDIYSDAEIKNSSITVDPKTGEVNISGEFLISEYAVSFQSGLEFRPLISGFLLDNPLQENTRNMTVRLDAPEFLMLSYEISYPSDFYLDESNQNRQIMFPGAEFKESYRTESNTIDYSYDIKISKRKFPPDVFPQILNLYERWVDLSTSTWFIKKEKD